MATGWPMKTTYANGDVYSASDVNDITGTINLLGSSVAYTAGKNKIINGDFKVWQRGSSFASIAANAYFADRFAATFSAGGGTNTFSRQTFTPGTAPVIGYEAEYYARLAVTSGGGSTTVGMYQKIEDVRTLAGQTATISFWAKADSARTLSVFTVQDFGSGGSGGVVTSTTKTLTTSWARYTYTVNLASISGKTVGTSSFLYIAIELGAGQASGSVTLDTWGWQVEQGSTATAFQTATGTIQGELAACQRYFVRLVDGSEKTAEAITLAQAYGTAGAIAALQWIVPMRTTPTMTISAIGHFGIFNASATVLTATGFALTSSGTSSRHGRLDIGVASGLVGGNSGYVLSNSASSTMDISAEL